MADNVQVSGGGISLCSAVFLVFLVLKLIGYINWSWWWVTAPLWGPFALILAIFIVIIIIAGIIAVVDNIKG